MNNGWVKISREVFYHEIADDKPWSRLATWIFLVAMASTGERTVQFRGHSYSLTRGQLSISLGDLEEKTGWSRGRVRCFFSYLKRKQMANTSGDPFCTLVSILNYDKWQGTNCQAVIGKKNDIASSIANDIASSIANDSPVAVEGCTNNIVHDIASSIANSQQNKNVVKEVLKKSTLEDVVELPKIPYAEIISHLNEKAHTSYKPTSELTRRHINARWQESFTLIDFYSVIDHMVDAWLDDPKMKAFLRPETLFGAKFEGYLNSPPVKIPSKGMPHMNVSPASAFDGSHDVIKVESEKICKSTGGA